MHDLKLIYESFKAYGHVRTCHTGEENIIKSVIPLGACPQHIPHPPYH